MRHPHPLPKKTLENLSTKRLLTVLKVARRFQDAFYCHCGCDLPTYQTDGITKEEWDEKISHVHGYIGEIKGILLTREHIS